MTDPFKQFKTIAQKKLNFKYPLYPLKELGEVKRRAVSSSALADHSGRTAVVIEKSKPGDFGCIAFPYREKVGTKKRFLAFRGELCIYEKAPEKSLLCHDELCLTGRGYFIVALKKTTVLPEYLLVLLRSGCLKEQLLARSHGRSLSMGIREAREILIPLPPLEIQQRIRDKWADEASKWVKFHKEEEKLKGLFARLEEVLAEKSTPEKARMEMRIPGKLLAGHNNWSYEYLSSVETRQARTLKIKDIAEVFVGQSIPEEYRGEGVPLYGSGNVLKGYLSGAPIAHVPAGLVGSRVDKNALAQEGEIMICVVGAKSLGKAAILIFSGEEALKNALINQSLARIKLKKEHDTPENRLFLAAYFNTKRFHREMYHKGRGSKNRYVGVGDIEDISIPDIALAGEKKVQEILDACEKTVMRIRKLERQLRPDDEVARECVEMYLL